MVVNGQWITTDEEIKRHKMEALFALQEAKQKLGFLLADVEQMSRKHYRVAQLLGNAKASSDFLQGPAVDLLQLPEMEYGESLNLKSIKALAEAVVIALKQVSDAKARIRELGVSE
jgi:hypothetical protein